MPPDIFAKRKAQAKKKAKTSNKVQAPIASNAEQMAACKMAMETRGAEDKERQHRILKKRALDDETRRKALEEKDRTQALAAASMAMSMDEAAWEAEMEREQAGAAQPAKRPSRRAPTSEAACLSSMRASLLDSPEFVSRLSYKRLQDLTTHDTSKLPTLQSVKDIVDEKRETSVLVSISGCVMTLRDVGVSGGLPPETSTEHADFVSWFSPGKWVDLVQLRVCGNAGAFKVITKNGNFNEVIETTTESPLDDPSKWPTVLNANVMPMAIRMTRSDPFPCGLGKSPSWRAMKLAAVKSEMSMTLHAAAHGFGPPIYSAASWPWERQEKDKHQKYGLIMVVLRMRGDATDFRELMEKTLLECKPTDDPHRPPAKYRSLAEHVSKSMCLRCYEMANAGLINFDIKPGNILVDDCISDPNFTDPSVYITDFDAVYCVPTEDSVASPKARFFVMMLLLSMHIRGYSSSAFADSFVRVVGPLLMELWEELHASYKDPSSNSFGEGAEWIYETEAAFDKKTGAFDHAMLRKITSPAGKLSCQLAMMTFEYMFDDTNGRMPPQRSVEWPGWTRTLTTGFFEPRNPRLVPQLLSFVVFHMQPVPERWKELLEP